MVSFNVLFDAGTRYAELVAELDTHRQQMATLARQAYRSGEYSQRELASALGVDRATIRKWVA